jgi:hypothetical protein
MKTKFHLALPILNELENLPDFLNDLRQQDNQNFILWVCVNHYEHWRNIPEKQKQINNNEKSLTYLKSIDDIEIRIIDKASQGKGWPRKKGGVGWARKTLMDAIASEAENHNLIISMDADTRYPENYLTAIGNTFSGNPAATGLSVPYYHRLCNNEENNRLILRYEIYMRNYALNMLRIGNPYAFSALGSAMAFPVWAYKKVGGLTPVISGEDFYFLQKLVKNGLVLFWTDTIAKPSPRLSDRVVFGTGPALIKGNSGDWSSYPIYHHTLFEKIKETFDLFPVLFEKDVPAPMDDFFKEQFKEENIWKPLRNNFKDQKNFIRACINKVDGLRILQYLRKQQESTFPDNNKNLVDFLFSFYNRKMDESFKKHFKDFDFDGAALCFLDLIRDFMFDKEVMLRKKHDTVIN